MTYPRVNLLKKSEQRYQGAVSRRFIMVGMVVTPILVVALLSGIKLVQYRGVQNELRSSRAIWKDLEPRLALFNEENQGLETNRRLLDLFEGWQNSQSPIVELMDGIQDAVPENIRFSRLSLRSDVTSASYEKPEAMALEYKLVIEGLSQGDRAEEDVLKFQKDLLERKAVGATFESIDLSSMRKRQSAAETTLRDFRLEGKQPKGGGK